MAAVTFMDRDLHQTGPTSRPALTVVATGRAIPRRPSPAALRRRRLVAGVAALLVGLGLLVVSAQAGDALGGDSLAAPERSPASAAVVTGPGHEVVVVPGDSLWSIAVRLAPGSDPRAVVDVFSRARHGVPLVPGERIAWPR